MRLFFYFILLLHCGILYAQKSTVQLPNGITVKDDTSIDNYKNTVLQKGENIGERIKKDHFIQVTLNKKNVVVGEPILVTYKLCTRLKSNSKLLTPPEFTGCSVIEMTTENLYATVENILGKQYKTYLIRRVQLMPLEAGVIKLGTATVSSNIEFTENEKNGVTQNGNQEVIVSNSTITINVQDLPQKNKPLNFDGAVGNFSIHATVLKQNDSVNSTNTLKITIEGEGNFSTVTCPTIIWPKKMDAFDTETTEQLDRLNFPVAGKKVFSVPFTCLQKGKAVIPSVKFSFYNIQQQRYSTIETDSLILDVQDELAAIDASKLSKNVTNKKYIWIIGAIALIVTLGLLYFFKMNDQQIATEKANQLKEDVVLAEIEPIVEQKETIYFINEIAKLELLDNNNLFLKAVKQIATELQTYKTDQTTILQTLINECNTALYAPNMQIDKVSIIERLRNCVNQSVYL